MVSNVAAARIFGVSTRGPSMGGAIFDCTGAYRYRLWREWDAARPSVAFVMLNPSTADAEGDDPTIRRCIGFARTWGFGRLEVVNLFALRATDAVELRRHAEPVGPENDRHIRELVGGAAAVVAAWGCHGALSARADAVEALLPPKIFELGRTIGGAPRHPLYVRRDAVLQARNPVAAVRGGPQHSDAWLSDAPLLGSLARLY